MRLGSMKKLQTKAKGDELEADPKIKSSSLLIASLLLALTTCVFWMSPLALGFSDKAYERMNFMLVHEVFMMLFVLGPAMLLSSALNGVITLITKEQEFLYRKILLISIITVIVAQILMLVFLTI